MVTNSFDEWGDAYYGSNGKQAAYTGWKQLNGEWYYFGLNHKTVYGWLQSGGGWYFFDEIYDEEAECWHYPMITNQYRVCDGKLYYFGSNGYCTGAVTKDGWYEIPWGKCYVQNGRVLGEGFHKIGNDYYYMNWENAVIVNDYVYFSDGLTEGARYFGADGKMIIKSGWHETRDGWIYIDRNGFVYSDGIYKIGNNQYTFRGCLWVQ